MTQHFSYPTKVFAHRGCGTLWPENTLESISLSKSLYGFNACEFDVMLSKDNVPYLMHDDILDRTVSSKQFKGLSFSDIMSEDVPNIDAGSWFDSSKYDLLKDIKVPLFEDVIKFCILNSIYMNIEIKPVPGYELITGETVAILTSSYFPSSSSPLCPLFSSFSYDALRAAKHEAPHIPRAYLISDISKNLRWKDEMKHLEAVAVHTNYKNLNNRLIEEIKGCGYKLFCYTINDVATAQELLYNGMDSFCTDRLDLFEHLV